MRRKWARTDAQRRRDLSIGCRHHDGGLNSDVKTSNRAERYAVRRALRGLTQ